MSVVERISFAARDGRVAVLWSHGRMTEHPRPGDRSPARVIGRLMDADEARAWAERHGFDELGVPLPAPPILDEGEDAMPSEVVTERYEEIVTRISAGEPASRAIEIVANEAGVSRASVSTGYYKWRRGEIAAGREFPELRGGSRPRAERPHYPRRRELAPSSNGEVGVEPVEHDDLSLDEAVLREIAVVTAEADRIAERLERLLRVAELLGLDV